MDQLCVTSYTPKGSETVALLHTLDYVQTELGCGRTRVFDLINRRELESVKVGRKRMVTDSSLRAFISRELEREGQAS